MFRPTKISDGFASIENIDVPEGRYRYVSYRIGHHVYVRIDVMINLHYLKVTLSLLIRKRLHSIVTGTAEETNGWGKNIFFVSFVMVILMGDVENVFTTSMVFNTLF